MDKTPESKALVRVKAKFQVTLPGVTLTPKSLIDRHIAEGLADLKAGRMHGPFHSAGEAVAALDKRDAATKKSKR